MQQPVVNAVLVELQRTGMLTRVRIIFLVYYYYIDMISMNKSKPSSDAMLLTECVRDNAVITLCWQGRRRTNSLS